MSFFRLTILGNRIKAYLHERKEQEVKLKSVGLIINREQRSSEEIKDEISDKEVQVEKLKKKIIDLRAEAQAHENKTEQQEVILSELEKSFKAWNRVNLKTLFILSKRLLIKRDKFKEYFRKIAQGEK